MGARWLAEVKERYVALEEESERDGKRKGWKRKKDGLLDEKAFSGGGKSQMAKVIKTQKVAFCCYAESLKNIQTLRLKKKR